MGQTGRIGIAVALLVTLGFGTWMRWALAGQVSLAFDFAHLRHAHSHLGYFGLLFPLAWAGWARVGAPVPGARMLWVYAAATVLSIVGFLRAGYGPEAIVGCTIVGGIWLIAAWPLVWRAKALFDPLPTVFPGVVFALGCIPPIALNLRTAPDVAHGFVASFLAGLLFLAVIPSAVAATRQTMGPWPMVLGAGILGSLSMGAWPSSVALGGLAVYGAALGWMAIRGGLPVHLRFAWGAVAVGLLGMAVGALPNVRPVALGAIHFLVLAPVLGALAEGWVTRSPPGWVWFANHGLAGVMAFALVAQAFGGGMWTWTVSAVSGSAILLGWAAWGVAELSWRWSGVSDT